MTDALSFIESAPAGCLVPVELARAAVAAARANGQQTSAPAPERHEPDTWRERLPRVPADTLLSVAEVAEAVGRPVSWVYRRTRPNPGPAVTPLPVTRRDGALWIKAGALRHWLTEQPGRRRQP